MKGRDSFDVACSLAAVVADAAAIFLGFMLAVWIRFESGLIPMLHEGLPPRSLYLQASIPITLLFLFINQSLGLYERPQLGTFSERIPRLVRATGLGILLTTALAFVIRTDPPLSRFTVAVALVTISVTLVLTRYILFQAELHLARGRQVSNRIMVVGTDEVAGRLRQSLENDPRLRTAVTAFLRVDQEPPHEGIPDELIRGTIADLPELLGTGAFDQVILASSASLPQQIMADMIIECEQALVDFHYVPDLFRILTITMDIRTIDGIPVLGTRKWPLDFFWNRVWKRMEDIIGSLVGLVLSAPVILVAAILIKRESPGPLFFRQERCGEKGACFNIYKLRTMRTDAEESSGPVWAVENDPRRTRIGAILRAYNIDELPQFWNVLRGDMSLVGPRPERPHFVEQFKEDIQRYMWRHFYKPGMTGWAQVNGLRGNTSIKDRSKYDLYYLENWSLALDFKIIARTFFSRENAY